MNEAVYQALVTRLKTVAGLYPLQTENTSITLDSNSPFARATVIHTRPTQVTVGVSGSDLHRGLLQVDLFVPVNSGTAAVNAMADAVIAAFPRSLILMADGVDVRLRLAYRETAGRSADSKFHHVPVSVEWQMVRPAQ